MKKILFASMSIPAIFILSALIAATGPGSGGSGPQPVCPISPFWCSNMSKPNASGLTNAGIYNLIPGTNVTFNTNVSNQLTINSSGGGGSFGPDGTLNTLSISNNIQFLSAGDINNAIRIHNGDVISVCFGGTNNFLNLVFNPGYFMISDFNGYPLFKQNLDGSFHFFNGLDCDTAGNLVTMGNVSANVFFGNGSGLTGVAMLSSANNLLAENDFAVTDYHDSVTVTNRIGIGGTLLAGIEPDGNAGINFLVGAIQAEVNIDTDGNLTVTNGSIKVINGQFTGKGTGLTNIPPSAIVSNGTYIANGTLATNSGSGNGGFLTESGANRKYSINGGILTNLTAGNIVGAISASSLSAPLAATNIAHVTTRTNILLATTYTNTTPTDYTVFGMAVKSSQPVTTVAGVCALQISVSGAKGFTNVVFSQQTVVASVFGSPQTNGVTVFSVPANSTWSLTDASSGTGNSVSLIGGQIFQ